MPGSLLPQPLFCVRSSTASLLIATSPLPSVPYHMEPVSLLNSKLLQILLHFVHPSLFVSISMSPLGQPSKEELLWQTGVTMWPAHHSLLAVTTSSSASSTWSASQCVVCQASLEAVTRSCHSSLGTPILAKS